MAIHDSAGESYFGGGARSLDASGAPWVTDIQPSLMTWAARADDLDEFDLVLATQASQDEPDVLLRARALLSNGDPAGACRTLGPSSDSLPSTGLPFSMRDMLVAACRASMGDDEAHRWLLHSSSLVMDQQFGWYAAYLVAVMSDLRQETDVADRAWRLLVEKYGAGTPPVQGRLVAAHVAERHGEDGPAVTRRLAQASTSLEGTAHTIAADPRPTLAAVNTLIGRHDTAGARLLLEYVARRNEISPAIRARLQELTPEHLMRRYRALVIGGFLLVPFALLAGGAGFALVLGGGWLFRNFVRVPGFSAAESVAWRAARQLRLDPKTGLPTAGHPDGGWIALAVLVGGVIGSVIGAQLMSVVEGLGDWATVGAWLGPLVLCTVIAYQVSNRWSQSRQQRARLMTRKEATRREVASVGACQCWNTGVLFDDVARAYARRHLVDARFEVDAETMSRALGSQTRVLRCPSLGTIWLLAVLTAEGSSLLLRGSSDTGDSSSDTAVGQYL